MLDAAAFKPYLHAVIEPTARQVVAAAAAHGEDPEILQARCTRLISDAVAQAGAHGLFVTESLQGVFRRRELEALILWFTDAVLSRAVQQRRNKRSEEP
jgi:hypothetical protein